MNLWSVIPAQNEERTIAHVITNCLMAGSKNVLVVSNGSTDKTYEIAGSYPNKKVLTYYVQEPLGIDVPRAVGAQFAHVRGAEAILFCDGDLAGNLAPHLAALFASVTLGCDLSLTNCYPQGLPGSGMAGRVTNERLCMNRHIGREDLGAAIMSHGPSCVSRKFMETLPCQSLAVPPLAQALSERQGLTVRIGASIAHYLLGSRERHGDHPDKIADLIIGDCLLAKSVFSGSLPSRCSDNRAYIGFDNTRRWDLLNYHLQLIKHQFRPTEPL